jgi:hypothetical protein
MEVGSQIHSPIIIIIIVISFPMQLTCLTLLKHLNKRTNLIIILADITGNCLGSAQFYNKPAAMSTT